MREDDNPDIISIQDALDTAEKMHNAFANDDLKMLRKWRHMYVKEYIVAELFKILDNTVHKKEIDVCDEILAFITKLNKE